MEDRYRISEVSITSYDLKYILAPPHLELRMKCYAFKENKSFKFKLPRGEKRMQAFLAILKAGETDELPEKTFQILYFQNRIYGISKIGDREEVKYIPCTPCDERGIYEKLMSYSALKALIAEKIRKNEPCYVEMM